MWYVEHFCFWASVIVIINQIGNAFGEVEKAKRSEEERRHQEIVAAIRANA